MTDSQTSLDVVLDGAPIWVEGRTATNVTGRSVLLGDLAPVGASDRSGTAAAFQEAADAGWHLNVLAGQLAWLALDGPQRHANALEQERAAGMSDFATPEGLLRPPWPIDLFYAAPSAGQAPYIGPRGARRWLNTLHPQPGEATVSFAVGEAWYSRKILGSERGVDQISSPSLVDESALAGMATLGKDTLSVSLNLAHNTARGESVGGSRSVQYFIPLQSISQVKFSGRWSTVKPWRGPDKEIVSQRGYSPIDKSRLTVRFSDGWRVCTMVINYDRYDHRRVSEDDVMGLASGLIDAANRSQGIHTEAVTLPLPDPVREGEQTRVERELVVDFDRAVHFGIPVPLSSLDEVISSDVEPAVLEPEPVVAAPEAGSVASSAPPASAQAETPTITGTGRFEFLRVPSHPGGTPPPPTAPPPPSAEDQPDPGLARELGEATAVGVAGCLAWLAPLAALAFVGWVLAAAGQEAAGFGFWVMIPAVFLLRGRLGAITGNYRGSQIAGRNRDGIQQFTSFMESARNTFWLFVGLAFAVIAVVLIIGGFGGSFQ